MEHPRHPRNEAAAQPGAKTLLIATNNRGKLVEIEAILKPLQITLVTPHHLGLRLKVNESGETYAQNAALKARAFAQASSLLTLADDSGLEVLALGGQPGVHSARYAPWPTAQDSDRRRLLLQRLQGIPRPWTARFRCVVAIAEPDGEQVHFTEGECWGEIIPEERGEHGFGYDPIFLLPHLGKTMAELPLEQKNTLSHRGRALQAAIPLLRNLLRIP